MSFYRKGKVPSIYFLAFSILALTILWIAESSRSDSRDPLSAQKIAAAKKMQEAMAAIEKEKLATGVPLNRADDPNGTGLIGLEYSDITTSLGSLSAKRTSTNPNFSGLMVEMLAQAGAKRNDFVAISFSGSFPALNIAVLSAAHTLGLNPVIISSVGSSTYGANDPDWTWLDMERLLRDRGILPYASHAASLGGIAGSIGGREGEGVKIGMEAIHRNRIPYLEEKGHETLEKDIQERLRIYSLAMEGKKPAAFINVGGTLTSLGDTPEILSLAPGLLEKVPQSSRPERGILFRMNETGIPVIHLLNIKKIARRNGLPVDPIPLPGIPGGRVMKPKFYSWPVGLGGLALLLFLLMVPRRKSSATRSLCNPIEPKSA